MSERFLIEAKNPNGIPITPPQDTRSDEGYLKDLTIEGTLTVSTGSIIAGAGFKPQFGKIMTLHHEESTAPYTVIINRTSTEAGRGVLLLQTESIGSSASILKCMGDAGGVFTIDSDCALTTNSTIKTTDTTDSTSKDTGAIITEGGLGVEKSAHIGNSLHTGGLNIKGIYLLDTSINANYTVTANISYVRVDDSGAIGAGVTLPAATGTGKIITIKDVGGSASSIPISISRTGSDTIDGLTSTNIPTNYGVLRVIDGASGRWDII
jgi:hypothetical protein